MELGQVHHIEYYVNDLQKSNKFGIGLPRNLAIAFLTDGAKAFLTLIKTELI